MTRGSHSRDLRLSPQAQRSAKKPCGKHDEDDDNDDDDDGDEEEEEKEEEEEEVLRWALLDSGPSKFSKNLASAPQVSVMSFSVDNHSFALGSSRRIGTEALVLVSYRDGSACTHTASVSIEASRFRARARKPELLSPLLRAAGAPTKAHKGTQRRKARWGAAWGASELPDGAYSEEEKAC